jgi:hypothetical protein
MSIIIRDEHKATHPRLYLFVAVLVGRYRCGKKLASTYNSGYSLVVTHLITNPPVRCLNRAERTGSLVFNVLWSYVEELQSFIYYDWRHFNYSE